MPRTGAIEIKVGDLPQVRQELAARNAALNVAWRLLADAYPNERGGWQGAPPEWLERVERWIGDHYTPIMGHDSDV